jgi:type II secretory pathway pseudopilin PulG
MAQSNTRGKSGQIVTLVVVAVLLAAAYVGLDMYGDGERNKAVAESRGTQVVQALSRFKLESGKYPEKLDTLVPKHIATLPKCPNGDAFDYAAAAGEYTLTCPKVGFKPYVYDSRNRGWQG